MPADAPAITGHHFEYGKDRPAAAAGGLLLPEGGWLLMGNLSEIFANGDPARLAKVPYQPRAHPLPEFPRHRVAVVKREAQRRQPNHASTVHAKREAGRGRVVAQRYAWPDDQPQRRQSKPG